MDKYLNITLSTVKELQKLEKEKLKREKAREEWNKKRLRDYIKKEVNKKLETENKKNKKEQEKSNFQLEVKEDLSKAFALQIALNNAKRKKEKKNKPVKVNTIHDMNSEK